MVRRVLSPGASPTPASPPPQPRPPPPLPPPPPSLLPPPPVTTAAAASAPTAKLYVGRLLHRCRRRREREQHNAVGNVSSYLRGVAHTEAFVGSSGGAEAGLSLADMLIISAWLAGLVYVASPGDSPTGRGGGGCRREIDKSEEGRRGCGRERGRLRGRGRG